MTGPGKTGALYIVSTPIGNMGDMSFRAVEVLSSAALVLAEDTRHSRRLLDHYEIPTRTAAYHEHNEARETPKLVRRLQDGESIALITDAGTDRKSTRLNSSHGYISYAVFCLKKKKTTK